MKPKAKIAGAKTDMVDRRNAARKIQVGLEVWPPLIFGGQWFANDDKFSCPPEKRGNRS